MHKEITDQGALKGTEDGWKLIYQYWVSQAIHAMVKLELPKLLHASNSQPLSVVELLAKFNTQVNKDYLFRFLQCLCSFGIINEPEPGKFRLTELGDELRHEETQQFILQLFSNERWEKISLLSFLNQAQDNNSEKIAVLFEKKSRPEQVSEALYKLIYGYQLAKAIYIASELQLFDKLDVDSAVSCEALTTKLLQENINITSEILKQLMKILAENALLIENKDSQFCLLLTGELFKSAADSRLDIIALHENSAKWLTAGALDYCINNGEGCFKHIHGLSFYELLEQRPEEMEIFNEAMTHISCMENQAIVDNMQFSGDILDVGGGQGQLLSAILAKNKEAKGILFDLSETIDGVTDKPERCQLVKGDFFAPETIPSANIIILKRVLHNWDNENAAQILKNCLAALKDNGEIVIIERLYQPGFTAVLALLDMAIGGKIRSEEEFRELFEGARITYKNKILQPLAGGLYSIRLQEPALQNQSKTASAIVLTQQGLFAAATESSALQAPHTETMSVASDARMNVSQ